MNKKIGIVLVFVLLAGAVFLSACQSEVGRNINIPKESKINADFGNDSDSEVAIDDLGAYAEGIARNKDGAETPH